jgi:hypothetical protein
MSAIHAIVVDPDVTGRHEGNMRKKEVIIC